MMADVSLLFLLSLFVYMKSRRNLYLCSISLLFITFLSQAYASPDRVAFVDVRKDDGQTSFRKISSDSSDPNKIADLTLGEIEGTFSRAGSIKQARGKVVHIPTECGEDDERTFARLSKDWIGVIYYGVGGETSADNTTSGNCSTVIERVKKAFLFGASAIIILSLNQRIFKELDIDLLFSGPVIQVENQENITSLLSILTSKVKALIEITFNVSFYDLQKFTTITMWGMCGRYSGRSYVEWDGVICLGEDASESKADPGAFWNYFFSALFSLMMLYIMKTRRRNGPWVPAENDVEASFRRLAYKALAVMKTIKYKDLSHSDSQDVCAICLDKFYPRQKIRVLPCSHQFHTKCVDPWLVRSRTCPMCKLNVIEKILGDG